MVLMSLFSVFDPSSYFGLSLNWFILLLIMGLSLWKYYEVSSSGVMTFMMVKDMVTDMFKEVSFPNYNGLVFLSVFIFMYLFVSNLLGLFPFVFTLTAHPLITLGLGVVGWFSFFLMGWLKNFNYSAAHLVPEGSPIFLSPFMVIIETISHLIRPFTLSIRLAANMMAGHLIVSLLSSVSLLSFTWMVGSVFMQTVLMILEFGVCIIQGFVFSILLLLYALEYY